MRCLARLALLAVIVSATTTSLAVADGRRRHHKDYLTRSGKAEAGARVGATDGCKNRNGVPGCFRELLKCASAFFAAAKIDWRLTDGSLLGAVRSQGKSYPKGDGKFIPWDDDIDVAIDTTRGKGGSSGHFDYDYIIGEFKKFKATANGNRVWFSVDKVAYVDPNKPPGTEQNLRLLHSQCAHCNWAPQKQWLDMVNDEWTTLWETDANRKKIGYSDRFPATDCKLEGVAVKCAKDSKKYLSLWFGSGWTKPTYSKFSGGSWS